MEDEILKIKSPEILSDIWVERFGQDFEEKSLNASNDLIPIAIDFTETEWVELSALLMLTQSIISKLPNFSKIDFLFNFNDEVYSKEILRANMFLVNSSFFQAILSSLCRLESTPQIRFNIRINSHFSSESNVIELANNYFLKKSTTEDIDAKINLTYISDGSPVLTISFRGNRTIDFDSDFFKMFNLEVSSLEDIFIIPIVYICNNKEKDGICDGCASAISRHVEFLSSKEALSSILKRNIYLNFSDYAFSAEFIEIISTWCSELLKNVRDHGGEHTLLSLRLGDWTTRRSYDSTDTRNVITKGICYSSKVLYFEKIKSKNTTKFIDIHMIDNGGGFETLKAACKLDKLISNKKCESIRYLHRYAMLPHTTSKIIPDSEIAPIHITGLGLISEQAISRDAYISIKDRKIMTYFTKDKLGHITNEGDNDQSSDWDLNSTMVSCIIPFEDVEWSRNNTYRMDYINSNYENFLYINDFSSHDISKLNLYEYSFINKKHKVINQLNNLDIAIVDLSNTAEAFSKPVALKTVNIIYHLIENNIPVILYGANVPEMRIIQTGVSEINP